MVQIPTDQSLELVHLKLNQIQQALAGLENNHKMYTPLTTKELAIHLKTSTRNIQKWRDEGKICFRKVGRNIWYTYEDVLAFLEKNKVKSWS